MIHAPYTEHNQFPEAWRNFTLRALVNLGDHALASFVRRGEFVSNGYRDINTILTILEAELTSSARATAPLIRRAPVLRPLVGAWHAYLQSNASAEPTSAAFQAVEGSWALLAEAKEALRAYAS